MATQTTEEEIVLVRHGDDGVKPTSLVRRFIETKYAEGTVEILTIDRLKGRTADGRYRYRVTFNLDVD